MNIWVRRLGLFFVVVLLAVGSVLSSERTKVETTTMPRSFDRAVVFAIPGLNVDDVRNHTMPTMAAMAQRGAIAGMNVRTPGKVPSEVEAYASLGAGSRLAAGDAGFQAYGADEPLEGTTAREVVQASTDVPITGSLVVPRMPGLADTGDGGPSLTGSLAKSIHDAGRLTAVVANSDTRTQSGQSRRAAPAALAAASPEGSIDLGSVSSDLLVEDPATPYGLAASPGAFAEATSDALRQAAVVIVDPGETSRLAEAVAAADDPNEEPSPTDLSPVEVDAMRQAALARTDAVLARVSSALPPNTLLLVVGVTPPGTTWSLTPLVAVGPGVPAGYLHSSTTHRPALVTLPDVAPTVLAALDVEPAEAMLGHALQFRPGDSSWDDIRSLDDLLESRAPVDQAMTVTFIVVQALLYAVAVGVLVRRNSARSLTELLILAVLTCSAWPLATFWLRLESSLYSAGAGTFALTWVVAAAVAAIASRLRAHPLDPMLAICGLTVATIVVDLATGAHLQYGSFFGYAPNSAPRYTGIGNAAFALLSGATIAVMAAVVARSKDWATGCWVAGAVALAAVLADGAPWMGADVGGLLTLVPVMGLTLWALSGRRISWRTLGIAVAAAAVALAIAVGIEALRAPEQRTHVGRFFLRIGDGELVRSTLSRKWSTNMRVLRQSPWAWLVPITAAFGFYVLIVGRAWRRLLPPGSPERIGIMATLATGIVGWLLNDSGVMVLALASMYLGPYVLLLALRGPSNADREQAARPTLYPTGAERASNVTEPMATESNAVSADDEPGPLVVAIVPAKDRADSIARTVHALLSVQTVDRVLVVDDGSGDDTTAEARRAGADVLRLPVNRGKGGAVMAGVAETPDADVYLLIDADLASTAGAADVLLDPVLSDDADMTIGVLPSAGGRGGFGAIKNLAGRGVQRASGYEPRAPLSGQRAIRAELLRSLRSAERFGLEVAMTIDVVRAGARVLEVDVPMDHRHTGRSLAGFAHRGRQGIDIARVLLPRLTSARQRVAGMVLVAMLLGVIAMVSGANQSPVTDPLGATPTKVLVFGMQPFGFDDLGSGATPNLERLIDEGALGAMSVRTVSRRPSAEEGYLSIGAGARLRSAGLADMIIPADKEVVGGTAADYVASLSGSEPSGELVSLGGPAVTRRNEGPAAASTPGALGDALAAAGLTGSTVGNSDQPPTFSSDGYESRPAGLAVMSSNFGIPRGVVDPEQLLTSDPTAPYGVRADIDAVVAASLDELDHADVVVVDPGDLTRAERFGRVALVEAREEQWDQALRRTDRILGQIVNGVDDDTLVMVVSVSAADRAFRLTPFVTWGPGVPEGTITSPSTQRHGLSALTDIAPTILSALGVDVPVDLPGNPVRYEPGDVDRGALRTLDADTVVRERTYGGVSKLFMRAHLYLYALALLVITARPRFPSGAPFIRWAALALTAYPVASFLVRLVPGLTDTSFVQGQGLLAAAMAGAIAYVAGRSRRHPLSSLAWVLGLTVVVILVDTWTGTHLQTSSWLGYSLHNAGRFYGVPNTTFAVLGAATLVWAGIIVDRSSRRREAVWLVGCVFGLVLVSAGLPMLGADVGTLITLFPIFAVLGVVLSGRKVRIRTLVLAGVAMVALVVVAAGIDLARPVADRTHLGQFAQRFLDDGPSALVDTFTRKQSANLRILGGSLWSEMVPIVGIFLFIPLVWERRAAELFPRGSAIRASCVAVVASAALGFASNDSGPIVIALFLAILPPVVTLLALGSRVGPPQLLPAIASTGDPP